LHQGIRIGITGCSVLTLRAAALHGQGFIITPAPFVIDDLKSGALVAVLSDFLPKQFSIDALYPHREHLPAKVRTFIDVLAKGQKFLPLNFLEPRDGAAARPMVGGAKHSLHFGLQ
jgi:DNA-binding transcriptional LysR family regulator